jgi:arylformamidase
MYLNLSYSLTNREIALEPGLEHPHVIPRSRLSAGNHSNTSYFKMFAHTGTHLDAPWHFELKGLSISDFKVQELVFSNVCVLDIPTPADSAIPAEPFAKKNNLLKDCDCLLVRTGFGGYRSGKSEDYFSHNPGFSTEAAAYLTSLDKLRCLGMDLPSVENVPRGRQTDFPVHHLLLGQSKPMLLLEDANLTVLETRKVSRLFLFPILLEGLEAAPVTAVAEIDDQGLK